MIAPTYDEDHVTTDTQERYLERHDIERSAVGPARRFLQRHPKSFTAAAVLLGVTLGWVIKRADFKKS